MHHEHIPLIHLPRHPALTVFMRYLSLAVVPPLGQAPLPKVDGSAAIPGGLWDSAGTTSALFPTGNPTPLQGIWPALSSLLPDISSSSVAGLAGPPGQLRTAPGQLECQFPLLSSSNLHFPSKDQPGRVTQLKVQLGTGFPHLSTAPGFGQPPVPSQAQGRGLGTA